MNRYCRFILTKGGGYCIAQQPETDQQLIKSLTALFGDRLVRVEIAGRIIEVNK